MLDEDELQLTVLLCILFPLVSISDMMLLSLDVLSPERVESIIHIVQMDVYSGRSQLL